MPFSIRGIKLHLHPSLIFLLVYVALLAALRFNDVATEAGIDPTSVQGSPLVWSIGFAVGLCISVVLHEFSHAFVARTVGLNVRGIVLMMLGGVTIIDGQTKRPRDEFKFSIVGPLVSFALAGLLFFIRAQATTPEIELIGYWLGNANLALGIFNLLPAFPLDGGRALRALLVARLGDVKGTSFAVKVSHVFSGMFAVIGFMQFNIFLMLIALFLYATAKAELKAAEERALLTSAPVEQEESRAA